MHLENINIRGRYQSKNISLLLFCINPPTHITNTTFVMHGTGNNKKITTLVCTFFQEGWPRPRVKTENCCIHGYLLGVDVVHRITP